MTGNETAAWAALVSGADIMFGYPITPERDNALLTCLAHSMDGVFTNRR